MRRPLIWPIRSWARALRECAALALAVEGTARRIFGPVDEMKFRSSMTLFAAAAPGEDLFQRCLEKYFAGAPDPATRCKSSSARQFDLQRKSSY